MKRSPLVAATLLMLPLIGCLELERVEAKVEQLATALNAIRPLVEKGEFQIAREQLAELVANDEVLSEKLDRYRFRVASISETPGTRAFRERLQDRSLPSLSYDEMRALYLLSFLSLLLPEDGGCGFVPVMYLGALSGYPLSQFQVGGLLGRGNVCGWPQDLGESVYWYIKAGEQGHSDAQVNHAMAMLFGKGTRKDQASAIDLLTRNAADSRNPKAQYLLGMLETDGHTVAKNEGEALDWFRKAADQGFEPAQVQLGTILWKRAKSLPQWEEARRWFLRAAEQGDAEGQYQLAKTYVAGVDGEFWRFDEAMKWFEAAAQRGHLEAQTALGLQYWEGDIRTHSMAADHHKAMEWLSKAAARGNARAQTYLGYAYFEGKGAPLNQDAAIGWWRKAAEQNDSRAEEALGWAYEHGRGVPRDMREARNWYSRAKSHGSVGASDKLKGSEFEALAQQDKAFALFLGLLVLGVVTAGDSSAAGSSYSQGCATTFGAFQQVCDGATDLAWAARQLKIW